MRCAPLTAWPAAGRGARRAAFAESDLLSQNLTVFNVLRITKSDNQASNVYHAFTNPEADYYGIARASSRKRIEWFHADFSDRVRPANGGGKDRTIPGPVSLGSDVLSRTILAPSTTKLPDDG